MYGVAKEVPSAWTKKPSLSTTLIRAPGAQTWGPSRSEGSCGAEVRQGNQRAVCNIYFLYLPRQIRAE